MPTDLSKLRHGTELLKRGFASMQKGGVIMDVTNADQARVAEEAGAVAVMALQAVPADIRAAGGVARMADPRKIREIIDAVTIPVMAKCRIGHTAEAQVLEALGVDMIDESEVLTSADPYFHVFKEGFTVPFVCGATNLGEAVRRIAEGAAMIRTKGEAGTGDIAEAVRHRRLMTRGIHVAQELDKAGLDRLVRAFMERYERLDRGVLDGMGQRRKPQAGTHSIPPAELARRIRSVLADVRRLGRLPVVDFAAGGVATPADAALMMQLGADGVFVGSGIFKSENPERTAKAVVEAVAYWDDPQRLAEIAGGLGEPMKGMSVQSLEEKQLLQTRGI